MKRIIISALIAALAAGAVFAQNAPAPAAPAAAQPAPAAAPAAPAQQPAAAPAAQPAQNQQAPAQAANAPAQAPEIGAPNAEKIGIDTAQQKLKEVSVEKFEHDGYWTSHISPDFGYATSRLFLGSPAGKKPIPDEDGLNIPDKYVLGTRVDFLRRGYTSIFFYPARPIPVAGITKTISIWVAGRNYNHDLYVLVQDYFGRDFELYMGKLNFQGWKKLVVAVPPQAEDGIHGIVQRNYHYNNNMGIKIVGLRIDPDPMEAYGSYYVYFDDMRAVTDLFAEDDRDADDIPDSW